MVHNLVNQFILSVNKRSISTKLILWCDGIVAHMYNLIIIDIDYQHISFSNNVSPVASGNVSKISFNLF